MKNTFSFFLTICLTLAASWLALGEDPSRQVRGGNVSGGPSRALSIQPQSANVLLDLSGRLLNAAVAGDKDETSDVNDEIYGMPLTGKSRTRAKVFAQLVPDGDNAVADVFLRGQTISDTIGMPPQQSLLIYSTTTTPFIARKRIYFNGAGVNGYPAQARAQSSIDLKLITDLKGRTDTFRTDMAELQYQVKKLFYEHYTNQKTETQLIEKLENGFQPMILQANSAFDNGLKQIKIQGIPLREFHFGTTENLVSANAQVGLPGQNTPADPPLTPPEPFDVSARAHQSALNDTFQILLAGKTFTADELEGVVGKKPASLQAQLGRQFAGMISEENVFKLASVTFADKEPIVTAFADHGFTVTINIKEFHIHSPYFLTGGGEEKVKGAGLRLSGLKMRVIYKFQNAPGRVEAVRQGSVQILPFYPHKIGGKILGAVLQSRINQYFKERLPVPNLPVPADLSQIGTLAANGADAGNGWVVLTWLRQPGKK